MKQLKILYVIPFNQLYPAVNGGMQRCFHLLHQLTKNFKVTVIINQDKNDFLEAAKEYPALLTADIYSTMDNEAIKDIFSLFPSKVENALRYRWYKKSFRGPADSYFLLYHPVLKKLLETEKYHTIILEKLSTLNAVSVIRKYDRKVKILYDAHNVDSNIAISTGNKNVGLIKKAEASLHMLTDAVIACSTKDLETLKSMNGYKLSGTVIPNGVVIESRLYDNGVRQEKPEYILFCGSLNYEPNVEGLRWFYKDIWGEIKKSFPFIKLIVVGSGTVPDSLEIMKSDPDNIFTGLVPDVREFYNMASIAVVPLKSGSGTRLKVLEAMALGLPVISTSKGAEGIDYTHQENILIADEALQFAGRAVELVTHKNRRLTLQENGRNLVKEKYDWDVIGENLADFINEAELVNRSIR